MNSRLVIAKRELRSLRREKTILLAILTQLVIAAFSAFLIVGLVTVYSPGGASSVPVDVGISGNASPAVSEALEQSGVTVTRYESRQAAVSAFSNGRHDAVVQATRNPAGNVTVAVIAPEGELRSTVTVARLKTALSSLERERRAELSHRLEYEPLALPDRVSGGSYVGFTYTILVPLLVLMPVFISGSIVADSLTEELERQTAELLRVTPLSEAAIVDGKVLGAVLLAPAQVGLWMLFLHLNAITIAAPVLLLGLTTALALLATAIGAISALIAGERRGAQLMYAALVLGAVGGLAVPLRNPVNEIARLAIGSADSGTLRIVAILGVVALLAFLGVRRQSRRLLRE